MEEGIKGIQTESNIFKLNLQSSGSEGLLVGIKQSGEKYSVREHRMAYFMPGDWLKVVDNLRSDRAKRTANILIQTGARINEARNIRKDDCDFERNTIRLRVTKTKAKKGEKKGKPRTIPMSSEYMKQLKRFFSDKPDDASIDILSTPGFNLVLKRAIQRAGIKEFYMYSAHNIRKTHGNWLKIMGNLRMMNIDATEICLRLGHDYNTFLKDYGSSGVMDSKDVMLIKKVLGDLYATTHNF